MYHRKYRIQFREGEINSLCIILIVSNIMIRKFYKILILMFYCCKKYFPNETYTKRDKMCNIDKNLRVDFISTLLSITNNFRSILKNNNVYVLSFYNSKEPEVIDFKTRSIVNDQRGGRRKGLWKKKEQTRIVSKGYSVDIWPSFYHDFSNDGRW